jgi:hypothetical protein
MNVADCAYIGERVLNNATLFDDTPRVSQTEDKRYPYMCRKCRARVLHVCATMMSRVVNIGITSSNDRIPKI